MKHLCSFVFKTTSTVWTVCVTPIADFDSEATLNLLPMINISTGKSHSSSQDLIDAAVLMEGTLRSKLAWQADSQRAHLRSIFKVSARQKKVTCVPMSQSASQCDSIRASRLPSGHHSMRLPKMQNNPTIHLKHRIA